MDAIKIGEKLTKLRGDRTQAEVASACNVTRQAICLYEKGTRIAQDDVKERIAEYYGVSVQSIFFEN